MSGSSGGVLMQCATMAMEADLRRLRQIIDSDPQRKAEVVFKFKSLFTSRKQEESRIGVHGQVPVNLVEALSEVLDGAKPTDQENASSTV